MQLRYKKYRIYAVLAVAVLAYFLLRNRKNEIQFEFDVDNSSPILVWEYVADFSNMKHLNPTILDFTILTEKGNYDHWEYSTHYTEVLSHFPYVKNFAHAEFVVKPDGPDFIIISKHKTCFFTSLLCVRSESQFRFSSSVQQSHGTHCLEMITYECPAALTSLCAREVQYQRSAIRDNLKRHFAKSFSANIHPV